MSDATLTKQAEMPFATASVEDDGETQIVRLPKGFGLPGSQVKISRTEKGLLLQPIHAARKWTQEEVDEFFAQLDGYGADPLFPDGRNQGTFEVRDEIR